MVNIGIGDDTLMMNSTTSDETIYYNMGNGFVGSFENPYPEVKLYKKMPCGHLGLWIYDKWTCQTCWGWEKPIIESRL